MHELLLISRRAEALLLVAVFVAVSTSMGASAGAQSTPPKLAQLVPPSPVPNGFVADIPNVVLAAAKTEINARIRALQDSGYGDIGVAILPSIGDYQPYEVGLEIYRAWGIGRIDSLGSARRDLGFILLIVPKELAPDGERAVLDHHRTRRGRHCHRRDQRGDLPRQHHPASARARLRSGRPRGRRSDLRATAPRRGPDE